MPVVELIPTELSIKEFISSNNYVIFSKSYCPFCKKAKELFQSKGIEPAVTELDIKGKDGNIIQNILFKLTGLRTVPVIFAHGTLMGGCDDVICLEASSRFDNTLKLYQEQKLLKVEDPDKFDYDLAVIGGGSGGLACAKMAADHGFRVVVFDYVVPSSHGTKWGLGGTCVNVGCIPKKLMHQAAIHGENIRKSEHFGWQLDGTSSHDWVTMMSNIQSHIKSLNFAYRSALNKKNIKYYNSLARITSKHQITATSSNGSEISVTSKFVVIATGERPSLSNFPGVEHCITSDDLFWLKYKPGKILIVGASYVALECAGALKGMGFDVTVMVRSIFLRGYDQEMAERVGVFMEKHGVKFIKQHIPVKVEQITPPDVSNGNPGSHKVYYKSSDPSLSDEIFSDTYDTIMLAIGRESCTSEIGLDLFNIKVDQRKRIIAADNRETSDCSNVFAIGDVLSGRPQLTPVAIKAGRLLAQRLCGITYENTNYNIVPTTVFTPVEYGAIGLSEEDAISTYGEGEINVYYDYISCLEESIVHEIEPTDFYAKLICRASLNNKVVGLHVLSPNAGEITQGYAVALQMGATIYDFSKTFGIHPTNSEVFTGMSVTKGSGKEIVPGGC